jgi:hypothetical protein
MKIYKTAKAIIIESEGKKFVTEHTDWDSFVNRVSLFEFLKSEVPKSKPVTEEWFQQQELQAPIHDQEIWAAGRADGRIQRCGRGNLL